MVRICDGRMSGTAYGTVALHVTPEAAAGGPLARLATGDWISLDVRARRLELEVPAEELSARAPDASTVAAFAAPRRGCVAPRHRPRAAGRHRRRPRLPRRVDGIGRAVSRTDDITVGVPRVATVEAYVLAEGPFWDAPRQRLLWVDIAMDGCSRGRCTPMGRSP